MTAGGKIRCTKCGADNREGAKFCAECATPYRARSITRADDRNNQPPLHFSESLRIRGVLLDAGLRGRCANFVVEPEIRAAVRVGIDRV
jgi:hypothetical protein